MRRYKHQSLLKIIIFLILFLFISRVKGGNIDPIYSSILLDLRGILGQDRLLTLNQELYYAAVNGKIKAYRSDSIASYYSTDEILNRGSVSTVQTLNTIYLGRKVSKDTTLVDPFDPKDITSNSISYKMVYDAATNFRLEFNGLSLNFQQFMSGINLGQQHLFFISKEDLVQFLGKEKASIFFILCYQEMLKAITPDTTDIHDSLISYHYDLSPFISDRMRFVFNWKMYFAIVEVASNAVNPFPAYKTESLISTYTLDEILDRQYTAWTPNTPGYNDSIWVEDHGLDIGHCRMYSFSYLLSYDPTSMIAMARINAIGLYQPFYNNEKKKIPELISG